MTWSLFFFLRFEIFTSYFSFFPTCDSTQFSSFLLEVVAFFCLQVTVLEHSAVGNRMHSVVRSRNCFDFIRADADAVVCGSEHAIGK